MADGRIKIGNPAAQYPSAAQNLGAEKFDGSRKRRRERRSARTMYEGHWISEVYQRDTKLRECSNSRSMLNVPGEGDSDDDDEDEDEEE